MSVIYDWILNNNLNYKKKVLNWIETIVSKQKTLPKTGNNVYLNYHVNSNSSVGRAPAAIIGGLEDK